MCALAYIINYLYLCTRKCAYCAGSHANNTLIKSDLTFNWEEVGSVFLSEFVSEVLCGALKKKNIFIHYYLNFKLKCQD